MLKFIEFESCEVSGVHTLTLFSGPVHTTLEIFENSFISTVWPAVPTIPLKKTDIYENALENRRI